jgi:tRNA A-37 threonylcarbamoyl transferase component Bud32
MAELVVRLPYRNKTREYALTALKMTFPIWGLIAPIGVGVLAVLIGSSFLQNPHSPFVGETISQFFALLNTLLVAFLSGLIATNWLSNDAIVFDSSGLQLPSNLFGQKKGLPWDNVSSIELAYESAKDWRHKELVVTDKRKKRVCLPLEYLAPDQVEQITLALDMWAKNVAISESVQTLKHSVYGDTLPALSFTDMWQEELGRRFCPTAFIPLEPGRTIRNGAVKVLRHLALGGLSAVYLCQLENRSLVVLKEAVVSDDTTDSAAKMARSMLEREANMLLKLDHQAIVKVLDHFVDNNRDYLMLEYINGQDLRQLVNQNGPQSEGIVVDWALQMTAILKYLHEHDPPVIHRDFTPDNLVLRSDGSIILIDFGTANEFIGTATGTFVGKHAFIAPEQFRGKAVTQSDIYALGCTLYFLLTGEEPEALSTSNPNTQRDHLSEELCGLIETCTQLEAKDRFQSVGQLVPILRQLAAVFPMIK